MIFNSLLNTSVEGQLTDTQIAIVRSICNAGWHVSVDLENSLLVKVLAWKTLPGHTATQPQRFTTPLLVRDIDEPQAIGDCLLAALQIVEDQRYWMPMSPHSYNALQRVYVRVGWSAEVPQRFSFDRNGKRLWQGVPVKVTPPDDVTEDILRLLPPERPLDGTVYGFSPHNQKAIIRILTPQVEGSKFMDVETDGDHLERAAEIEGD